LLGPPAAAVLDAVPRADYLRAIVGGIEGLLEDLDWDTRNVLLTLARIWSTVATAAIRSKDEAATWALAHLPREHQPVLGRARAIYLGAEDGHWSALTAQLQPCVAYLVQAIQQVGAAEAPHAPSDTERVLR